MMCYSKTKKSQNRRKRFDGRRRLAECATVRKMYCARPFKTPFWALEVFTYGNISGGDEESPLLEKYNRHDECGGNHVFWALAQLLVLSCGRH
jgi:hypothetical protein